MLSYFPAIHPDELLYSVLARYHRHTCSLSPKQTIEDLFGRRDVRATVDLPGHLGALAKRLPTERGLTAERLACDLTLAPYHLAFQPPTVVREVLAAMIDGATEGVHLRLGIAASVVAQPRALRLCPRCFAEAIARWGEPYWRRLHQLPGVLVCPEHGEPLRDSGVVPGLIGQHAYLAALEEFAVRDVTVPDWAGNEPAMALLRALAVASAALLAQTPTGASFADLTARYRNAAIDRGLASAGGRVDQRRLHDAFATVMAPLRGILVEVGETGWLAAIVRNHRHAFHPLHHLLFALFLERFMPALMPAVPSISPPRRKRITDPGFDGRLRDLASSGLGLRAVARALAVDPNTVRKRGAALGLVATWKPWTPLPRPPKPSTGPLYRARWLALQHREPGLGRKALSARLSAEHAWLYRHDRSWLDTHVPEPMIRPPARPRTDWDALDRQLAAVLRVATDRIRDRIPPVRVTLAELEREIGCPEWIGKRRTKLSETIATLSAVTEDIEAFQLRRIVWAQEALIRSGEVALAWKVRRLAGLPGRASVPVECALASLASTE